MKNKVLVAAVAVLLSAGTAFAANTLAVNAGCAQGATNFGLQLSTDNTAANSVYVQSDHPNAETHLRLVWRMNLQNLQAPAAGAGRNFRFMTVHDNDSGPAHKIFFAQRQTTTGNWRLAIWSLGNNSIFGFGGGAFLGNYAANVDVQFDCDMTPGAGNGSIVCTRNGNPAINTTNLTDSSWQTDFVRFGFLDFDGFPGAAANGSACLDEYESYR